MTDLERFRAFLDEAGVLYEVEPRGEQVPGSGGLKPVEWRGLPGWTVTIEQRVGEQGARRDNPKVDGYSGFFIAAEFDESGALIKIGAWE